jgi:hypothetical protein
MHMRMSMTGRVPNHCLAMHGASLSYAPERCACAEDDAADRNKSGQGHPWVLPGQGMTFDCAGPLGSSDEADETLCSKATTGLFPSRTASFGGSTQTQMQERRTGVLASEGAR